MNSAPAAKRQPKPLIPAPRDEDILKAIAQYRFLTAQEITHLCYSKGSLTYARARLSALCGAQDITDKDFTEGYPIYRFGFPTGRLGNQERIFTISLTGRQILERIGISVPFHLKVAKLRTYSHSYYLHDLTRNRFVVSLTAWAKSKPNLSVESHLSYELAKTPAVVEIPVTGKMVKASVILDGLILVTDTHSRRSRILILEIDQNTQALPRFLKHIEERLAYVRSPAFTKVYGDIPYRIVYATQGVTESATKARLKAMCECTMKLLTERKRAAESQYFRFTTITFSTLYEAAQRLYEQPSWHLPSDPDLQSPVALFPDAKPQTS
jgi:hypothetical protein